MGCMLTFALAQLNVTVGDFTGNRTKILDAYRQASAENADMLICTELAVTGYAPEDLVLRPHFQHCAMDTIHQLAAATADSSTALIVGGIWSQDEKLYNTLFLLEKGTIQHSAYKHDLPNYGVFDEKRVFQPGHMPSVMHWRGITLAPIICEDSWNLDIAHYLAKQSVDLVISINASPFELGKHERRIERMQDNVHITGAPLIYVNQICGQDDVVYDGGSFVVAADGTIPYHLPHWKEAIAYTQWEQKNGTWQCLAQATLPETCREETIYNAMVLGLKDYVTKNRFPGVVLGLSGGIDSALSAAVAVDALGADKVWCVLLPSEFTSQESIDDATACAQLLGVKLDTLPIHQGFQALASTLEPLFVGKPRDLTEENLQSRLRGILLMALSNKFGHMVLTTGNKSEMAVGYATLYGDMCGGYNVLKDIYKTDVFAVARWRNRISPVMPDNVISKPPTAELRENQKDEDSLPPYATLDAILYQLIELQRSREYIIKSGYDKDVVEKVARLVYGAEYKRRQSAPGVKISTMQFGRDRRYPLTQKFQF